MDIHPNIHAVFKNMKNRYISKSINLILIDVHVTVTFTKVFKARKFCDLVDLFLFLLYSHIPLDKT